MTTSSANPYFVSTVVWVLASPFLFGFHIAALNQLQFSIQCPKVEGQTALPAAGSFPVCIDMSNATFGLITSIFTIGGLLGSLAANYFMNRFGRKGAVKFNAAFFLAGSALMTAAWSSNMLMLGRFVIGIGAGIAMCVGPVFLSEIAPQQIKGSVGVLNQLSVVIGLLLVQSIGFGVSQPGTHKWRIVFLVSAAICGAQLLLSASVADTPHWLTAVGRDSEAKAVSTKLWRARGISPIRSTSRTRDPESAEAQALLDAEVEAATSTTNEPNVVPLTTFELFKLESIRVPVFIIILAMFAQQISGINAVIFYSNAILARVIPGAEGYISLGIALLNAIMTLPAVYLVEKLGRRTLLLGSMTAVWIALVALGFGLNNGIVILSSVSILAFVGSFAIGLGPVPFVLVGDLVPFYAASATSSLALCVNWITNFFIGVAFLPFRDWLSIPDPNRPSGRSGEGYVFYWFAVVYGISLLIFVRLYR